MPLKTNYKTGKYVFRGAAGHIFFPITNRIQNDKTLLHGIGTKSIPGSIKGEAAPGRTASLKITPFRLGGWYGEENQICLRIVAGL